LAKFALQITNIMKRVLALSLIVTMALLFNGCKNGNKTQEKDINLDQPSFSQGEVQEPEEIVEEPVFKISTSKGDIVVKLYKETPLHRDNFVKLARSGYYDGMLFHRVIKDFMIQGGDPFTKQEGKEAQYGTGGPNYTIPAEIVPGKTHKKGALAAARRGDNINPEKDPRYLKSMPKITFEEFFLGNKEIHGCSEMIEVEEFRRLGGYNAAYFQEDFPMIMRLLYEYGSLPVISCVCCYYRIHGNNLSSLSNGENINKIFSNFLKTIESYKEHRLYPKAVKIWKMKWFSALAYKNKGEALKRLPSLATFSLPFLKRFPKLFIPSFLLKH